MRRVAYYIVAAIAVVALIAFFGNEVLSNRTTPVSTSYPDPIYKEPGVIYMSEPPTYSKQTIMNNISGELIDTKYGDVVVKITNNNDIDVDIDINIEKADDQGIVIDDSVDYVDAVAAHSTIYVAPYIEGYTADELDLYLDAQSSYAVSIADSITFETGDISEYDDLPITATNTSDYEPSSVVLSVLFYDQDDTLLDMREAYYFELYPNSSETDEVMLPYDENYDTVMYDHVEISVQSAPCYDVVYTNE